MVNKDVYIRDYFQRYALCKSMFYLLLLLLTYFTYYQQTSHAAHNNIYNSASGPTAWNSLPTAVHSDLSSSSCFRRHLKTELFNYGVNYRARSW